MVITYSKLEFHDSDIPATLLHLRVILKLRVEVDFHFIREDAPALVFRKTLGKTMISAPCAEN